jgi:hypothetical protein
LANAYRRDRTEGQPVALYLGVEKHGLLEQLSTWFGDLGLPIITLGGYSSQTQKDEVADDLAADLARQDRSSVLLYAGDFDPSGEDISRDFIARVGASVDSPTAFTDVRRIALSPAQVEQYDLPEDVGKVTNSRAPGFVARHGKLVQVELDALPPDVLRQLYADAIAEHWDDAAYQAVLEREVAERAVLQRRRKG